MYGSNVASKARLITPPVARTSCNAILVDPLSVNYDVRKTFRQRPFDMINFPDGLKNIFPIFHSHFNFNQPVRTQRRAHTHTFCSDSTQRRWTRDLRKNSPNRARCSQINKRRMMDACGGSCSGARSSLSARKQNEEEKKHPEMMENSTEEPMRTQFIPVKVRNVRL